MLALLHEVYKDGNFVRWVSETQPLGVIQEMLEYTCELRKRQDPDYQKEEENRKMAEWVADNREQVDALMAF